MLQAAEGQIILYLDSAVQEVVVCVCPVDKGGKGKLIDTLNGEERKVGADAGCWLLVAGCWCCSVVRACACQAAQLGYRVCTRGAVAVRSIV